MTYDLPRDPDQYTHRIGRTGRAGKTGLALSLFAESERYKLEGIAADHAREVEFEAVDTLPSQGEPLPPPGFVTLCIAGGRKQKVRPGDILGALTGGGGIEGQAVGKINVMDHVAYVAVRRKHAKKALQQLQVGKIKGRKFKVRKL